MRQKNSTSPILPYLGCVAVILIWAGWIVLSRHGAQTSLTALDLSFIRFTTALIFSVPFWFFYTWPKISLHRLILVGWSAGAVYTTLCFLAMNTAKAATAGVLINGFLPFFGAIIGYFWSRSRISRVTGIAILSVLVADGMLIGGDWSKLGNVQGGLAIVLFICASFSFSFYTVAVKKWNIQLLDIVVWIPIVNFFTILPFWLTQESGIPTTSSSVLLTQAIYQGVIVTLFAGFLVAYTIHSLGPVTSTMFMATVPGVAALMGYVFLEEPLSPIEVTSICLCSLALIINSRFSHSSPKALTSRDPASTE